MKDFLNITDSALEQMGEIIKQAPKNVEGLLLSIDNSGCSGYSYKLDFAYKDNVKNFEFVSRKGKKLCMTDKRIFNLFF